MNPVYLRIFEIVRHVPLGRITTYGAIAQFIGTKQGARLVGWAMNNSHGQENAVPAHRVVNRNGMLTGKHHFFGEDTMQQLLQSEGVQVVDDKIVDFDTLFWNPMIELEINEFNEIVKTV